MYHSVYSASCYFRWCYIHICFAPIQQFLMTFKPSVIGVLVFHS